MTGYLTAVAAAGSTALSIGSARDIALGGVFMTGNFLLIRMLVSRLILPGASKAMTLVLMLGKLSLFLLVLAGVGMQWDVEPMSFAFGATLLLVATVVEATVTGTAIPPRDDDHASATREN